MDILSESNGSKPRDVFITDTDLEAIALESSAKNVMSIILSQPTYDLL